MKKKFSWRVFISFGLTYSFIILFISGIILYIAPPGRYAHWVNWKIMGATKEGWQAFHTVFSFTFVILSIFHLFTVNWKAFWSYLKTKSKTGLNKKREFFISTILSIAFFFGIVYSVPPFSNIMDLGEYFTASWEQEKEEPPIPHAELLTLVELAEQMKLSSVDEIIRKLTLHEIKFDNTGQTLQELAKINETTPLEIYEQISKKSGTERQGSGIGRKTIEDFAIEVGKSPEEVMRILKENGIEAEEWQTLRDIGDKNNMPPRDIFDLFPK
ncbi:MAG: DUF4405 domain-containing protein [Prolixibacteraceae bacterium]|nr:DUF4405 domain-containing protein [Prolixibacteraceae bacterium]